MQTVVLLESGYVLCTHTYISNDSSIPTQCTHSILAKRIGVGAEQKDLIIKKLQT